MILEALKKVKKWLLSNTTGENFRGEKVTKYFPSDEYFSPTKIFPDEVFPDKVIRCNCLVSSKNLCRGSSVLANAMGLST